MFTNPFTKLLSAASKPKKKGKDNDRSGGGILSTIASSDGSIGECSSVDTTRFRKSHEYATAGSSCMNVCDKECQVDASCLMTYSYADEEHEDLRRENLPQRVSYIVGKSSTGNVESSIGYNHASFVTGQGSEGGMYVGAGQRNVKKKSFSQTSASGKYQILVVDNDLVSKLVLESMLSLDRFIIRHVFYAELRDLLDELIATDVLPDVMIMDADLLTEGTRWFVKELREHYNKYVLPVLITASSRHESNLYDVMDDDINDFMTKPFRYKEVIHRLANIIQVKRYIRKDSILSDILPANILSSLEAGENFVTQYHKSVTILFSDICQYTVISSTWPPRKIIHMLNKMFSGFDDICLSMSVYKVETVGDAYMIACGHDGTLGHVDNMVKVGLRMLHFVREEMNDYNIPIQIRVGIHTGEAFSGVIGKIRPRFCFFGDTVNTASRMESHGEPGMVQVSRAVYDAMSEGLKSKLEITCCGLKMIKGKGEMETFLISVPEWDHTTESLFARSSMGTIPDEFSGKLQKYDAATLFESLETPRHQARQHAEEAKIVNSFLVI